MSVYHDIAFSLFLFSLGIATVSMRASLPGPRILKFTSWHARIVEIYVTLGRGAPAINRLHKRYGPVVQIARNEVSVNSSSALRDLYAISQRLNRPDPLAIFHNYGAENLVSTEEGDLHMERRKPLRSLYAASAMEADENQAMLKTTVQRMHAYLANARQPVDMRFVLQMFLYEAMSYTVYGERYALKIVDNPDLQRSMARDAKYQEERLFNPWVIVTAFFPRFVLWLRKHNLAPGPLAGKMPEDILTDSINQTALADLKSRSHIEESTKHRPQSLIDQLYTHYRVNGPSPAVPSEAYIKSDCADHFWAGISTTLDALVPLLHRLSQPENRERQQRLRAELRSIIHVNGDEKALLPRVEELKRLSYLDALIRETLRLHPPIPATMTRRTSTLITVCGVTVPAGMKIGASPYVLGMRPDVYDEPERWVPERWLDEDGDEHNCTRDARDGKREKLKEMKRHFFGFGAGPRMCLGVNVAWACMRAAVAGVYGLEGGFETVLHGEDTMAAGWRGRLGLELILRRSGRAKE
jgi:cytochrome P450